MDNKQRKHRQKLDRYLEANGLLNYQTQGLSQAEISKRYQQAGVNVQGNWFQQAYGNRPQGNQQPQPQQIAPTQQAQQAPQYQQPAPQYAQPQSQQPAPTQYNSPYRYDTYKATEWMDQFKPNVPQWMYAPMDIVAGVADEPIRFFDWLRRRK